MSTQDGSPVTARSPSRDPADLIATVARARRGVLLRAHRHRLRREDLEDCFGQAALELVLRARRGAPFLSTEHAANALEQRFLSRIHDRRRAIEGRSEAQAAFESALSNGLSGGTEVADLRADVEQIMLDRLELSRIADVADGLTSDQRLVLACQVSMQMGCAEFCARFGWSPEKYRKVAQRARARLRALSDTADGIRLGAAEGADDRTVREPSGEPGRCGRRAGVPVMRGGRMRRQGPTYDDSLPHS